MTCFIAQKQKVFSKKKSFNWDADPVGLFESIFEEDNKANAVLLESADIITRKGEKSLIVVSAAVKATCRGLDICLESLSDNGKAALSTILKNLSSFVVQVEEKRVLLRFPKTDAKQNLQDRLLSVSSLDVLRVMTHAFLLPENISLEQFLVAGIFSYDVVDQFEDLPQAKEDELQFPDYVFWLPELLVIIDHRAQQTHLIEHQFDESLFVANAFDEVSEKINAMEGKAKKKNQTTNNSTDISFSMENLSDISNAEYAQIIEDVKKRIVAGDVFQIVPSRTFKLDCHSPFAAYRQLRSLNPSPYMYYVQDDGFTLLGASPETFIKVSQQGQLVEVRPIAGTRSRGFGADGQIDAELDMRLEAELKLDEKELAEHFMLVDLARNDIARVSKPKTRQVSKLLYVDRYSHVMHLVSCVQGELKSELDALHAYQASANMGTLVGAPKVKAAQILREVEKNKRGFYGGSVGYFDQSGNMDTAIVIRSALVQNGVAHVRAGAGIVYDSQVESEVAESCNKAKAVVKAIMLGEKK